MASYRLQSARSKGGEEEWTQRIVFNGPLRSRLARRRCSNPRRNRSRWGTRGCGKSLQNLGVGHCGGTDLLYLRFASATAGGGLPLLLMMRLLHKLLLLMKQKLSPQSALQNAEMGRHGDTETRGFMLSPCHALTASRPLRDRDALCGKMILEFELETKQ